MTTLYSFPVSIRRKFFFVHLKSQFQIRHLHRDHQCLLEVFFFISGYSTTSFVSFISFYVAHNRCRRRGNDSRLDTQVVTWGDIYWYTLGGWWGGLARFVGGGLEKAEFLLLYFPWKKVKLLKVKCWGVLDTNWGLLQKRRSLFFAFADKGREVHTINKTIIITRR